MKETIVLIFIMLIIINGLDITSDDVNEALRLLEIIKNRLNDFNNTKNKHPYITIAYAQTIDGSISPSIKSRLNISSVTSFKLLHSIRKYHDAVLVGINTLASDNPRLNIRQALPGIDIPETQPRSVVLDTNLKILNLKNIQLQRPIIVTCVSSNDERFMVAQEFVSKIDGVILNCKHDSKMRCCFINAMEVLKKFGIDSVLVEGGAEIIQTALQSNICHQVLVTIRPCYLGGYRVISNEMNTLAQLYDINLSSLGGDIVILGKIFQDNFLCSSDRTSYQFDQDGTFLRSKVKIIKYKNIMQ